MKSRIANCGSRKVFWVAPLVAVITAICFFKIAFAQSEFSSLRNPQSAIRNPNPEAAATLVIYNKNDPVSFDLASYYAQRRGIALDRVVGLACSINEEISRDEYNHTIAEPLRAIFSARGWWKAPPEPDEPVMENAMRFIALMRGMPLKISPATNYPGDKPFAGKAELNRNEAAVDSELATLGSRARVISGPTANPYYRSFKPFLETQFAPLMLVCRLDGPTGAIVRRMIDDSIATEQNGLFGFAYIDSRGPLDGGYAEGEKWLAGAAKDARENGIPVIVDSSPEQFPVDYPMHYAALYLGWYSQNVAGPISRDDFIFQKGAVAVHIHSASGASVRDINSFWVGPLLLRGAAATLGNVYEPYLALTPNLDVFEERLRSGFTFAESAYMAQRALSWMTTFVGDPLYRPFKIIPDASSDATSKKQNAEWIAYRDGAHIWFTKNRADGEKALLASAREMHSGIIFEGLGLLQWDVARDSAAAMNSFEQAERIDAESDVEDAVRTVIHRVQIFKAQEKNSDALALARKGIAAYPRARATNVLRAFERELGAQPSPQNSAAPAKTPSF